jgi:hypothetical protein
MATEAARLERKESTGRKREKREERKHTWLIPAFSWKELEPGVEFGTLRWIQPEPVSLRNPGEL